MHLRTPAASSHGLPVYCFDNWAGAESWDILMADGFEVKTIASFSRVPLSSRCLINAALTRKDKEILFLTKGDRFLYVIDNGKHSNTYLFPSNVVYFEVSGQSITTVTDDGRVWRTAVTKQKNKKNKHQSNQDGVSTSSQAIFTELLSKETKNFNQVHTDPSVDVIEVLASQAILLEPRIQAIFTLEDSLFSFGAKESGCVVSSYASKNEHENRFVCYSQTPFKMFLNAPADSHKDKLWPIPLLCYREKTDNCLCSNIIDRKLFNLLLPTGKTDELNIAGITCLLLIGTPGGQVLTHDLDQTGVETTKKSSFKLLYHLEQSVVGLHLVQLPELHTSSKHTRNEHMTSVDENNPVHNIVVMIGSKGKCIFIYQSEEVCSFSKHNLAGPVHCSSVKSSKDSTCIIHSNGREVCISKLFISKNKGPEKDDFSIVMSSIFICISGICCIYPLNTNIYDSISTSVKAVAMTTKGKLLEISLPGSGNKFPVTLFSKQPGLHLRELLGKIENVAVQLNMLEQDLESIDKLLEQLNYASTLMAKVSRTLPPTGNSVMGEQSSQYISWNVKPMLVSEGNILTNRVQYSLKFEVINQSSISLSSQWSLLISVQNKSSVLSYTVALDSLTPQSAREFVITLPDSVDLRHCLVVETFLCCDIGSFSSALLHVSEEQPALNVENNSLVISLGKNVIDIFSFAPCLVDFLSHDTCKFSLANQSLEHLKSSCKDNESICLKQCSMDDELRTIVVPVSKNFLHRIASTGSKDRNTEAKVLHLLLGDLSDNCSSKKDAKTSAQARKDNRCNLTVMVAGSTSAEGRHDGIDIVLKASTKIGMMMLLEAVIARLKFLLETSEGAVTAVRADDLQRILKTIQRRI